MFFYLWWNIYIFFIGVVKENWLFGGKILKYDLSKRIWKWGESEKYNKFNGIKRKIVLKIKWKK